LGQRAGKRENNGLGHQVWILISTTLSWRSVHRANARPAPTENLFGGGEVFLKVEILDSTKLMIETLKTQLDPKFQMSKFQPGDTQTDFTEATKTDVR
jgi:hypothetical protein